MKHKGLWTGAAVMLFLLSAAASAVMYFGHRGRAVEIVSDGQVLYTIDLDREPDRDITVEYKGRRNLIRIRGGQIWVEEADCPDHTCIKMGKLGEAGGPIVCLPNRLIIRYTEEGGDVDVTAG